MGETILLGIILAIIFYELTDVSPGGIVVPGIFAYYMYDLRRLLLTLIIALIAWFIVRLLARIAVLYGRRLFVTHILAAVLFGAMFTALIQWFQIGWLDIPIIGTIIAGILAHEINRQGIIKTVSALVVVTLLTSMVVLVL